MKPRQTVMHCPCGNAKVLAKGLCATCYTLKRQDEEYFGGHREEVLKRDGYRCRVPGCTTVKRGKRSIAVEADWPDFLRVLWREQHPDGHEQSALRFDRLQPSATNQNLFTYLEGDSPGNDPHTNR